jgi:hypothetical protein
MSAVSNQAYLSIWCKDFPEDLILERFGGFLETVPLSLTKPGFTYLVIRAVDYTEVPLLEQDLRSAPLDAEGIIGIAQEHLHNDCSYEVRSHWDLWVFDSESGRWQVQPQALEIYCHGQDYDGGFWQENGHLEANLGFEHFFTGHAGLLGILRIAKSAPQSPEEERFLASMTQPANLQMYQEKTRENIRKLLDWNRRIEKAVPVERVQLWSEGEENFELRLEEILAVH